MEENDQLQGGVKSLGRTALIGLPLVLGVLIYGQYTAIFNYSTIPKWILVGIAIVPLLTFSKPSRSFVKGPLVWWWCFVALFMLQCLSSYNPWEAFTHAVPLALAPLIVLSVSSGKETYGSLFLNVARALGLLLLPLLGYTLFEMLQLVLSDAYDHQATYTFRYAFGHRNQFGQFIALSLPIFLWGAWKEHSLLRVLFVLTILLSLVVILLLWNRTAILVAFGLYPMALAGWYVRKKWLTTTRARTIVGGALLLLVCLLLIPSVRKNTPIIGPLLETDFGSGNERVRLWSNSLQIWEEKPLLGHGSGDWKIEILRTDLIHTQAQDGFVFYQRAHNDFLQTLVETGLVGFLLLCAFFVYAFRGVIRSQLDPVLKLLVIMGITGFLAVANLSFPLERIELLVLLFLLVLPAIPKEKEQKPKNTLVYTSVAIAFSIALVVFSITWLIKEKQFFTYQKTGELALLKTLDKDVYSISPTSTPIYWEQGNIRFGIGDYAGAGEDYTKALQYNPYHIHALNNLGTCYYVQGDVKKAESLYKRALKLNPRFSEALINEAALRFNEGDIDGALNYILKVPLGKETAAYRSIVVPIARAKCVWLLELYNDPEFEAFLTNVMNDEAFLYQIATDARNSWRSYEDELRYFLANKYKK